MRVRLGAVLLAGIAAMAVPVVVAKVKDGDGGKNRIVGTAKADHLDGRGGSDILRGKGGADKIRGGAGHDDIDGGPGNDRIKGGRGADVIIGGKGGDRIVGGRMPDQINMLDGVPIPSPGRDVIKAKDGERDQINCGAGFDKVFVDEVEDGVYDCEVVVEP